MKSVVMCVIYVYVYVCTYECIFIGRTDAEAETPKLWSPDAKNWLIGKDPDSGKNWRQEEKGTTEDETVRWHHQLDGREFEQAPGVGYGQGSLVCCSSWDCKELDTAEWLNSTERYGIQKRSRLLFSEFNDKGLKQRVPLDHNFD